jgi:thymidine kinase
MNNPEFIIFTGPMFSSKTTKLLACLERYKYQKRTIHAFKPLIDDRYSEHEISTHSGWKQPAQNIRTGGDLLIWAKNMMAKGERCDIIAVDEAFMIPEIGPALISLYMSGLTIVVSSLEMSSSCNPFKEIVALFPFSTKIEKCSAVCTICGSNAHYTHRKTSDKAEIAVGGEEMYEPRCWQHHEISIRGGRWSNE